MNNQGYSFLETVRNKGKSKFLVDFYNGNKSYDY